MTAAATFARRVLEARRTGILLGPGIEPASSGEAYEVQRRTAEALGASVAGWKVAVHPKLGPIAAPIFSNVAHENGASWPVAAGLSIEIEIALWLNRDLPQGKYSRKAIAAAVDGYAVGVELVGARLADTTRNLHAFLGDLMANAGYVMGPGRTPFDALDLPKHRCRFSFGDTILHDAPCVPPALDPLAVTAAWLTHAEDALGGLKAGQFVTTGTLCGLLPVPGKGRARAEVEGLGAVDLMFI